jgi:hypothetical protein
MRIKLRHTAFDEQTRTEKRRKAESGEQAGEERE